MASIFALMSAAAVFGVLLRHSSFRVLSNVGFVYDDRLSDSSDIRYLGETNQKYTNHRSLETQLFVDFLGFFNH